MVSPLGVLVPPRPVPSGLTGACGLVRAHWYLAVICFPGLEQPLLEHNPLCSAPLPHRPPEDAVPDHCRPLSPDRDRVDTSEDPPPSLPGDPSDGDVTQEDASFPEGGQEPHYTSKSPSRRALSTGRTSSEDFLPGL